MRTDATTFVPALFLLAVGLFAAAPGCAGHGGAQGRDAAPGSGGTVAAGGAASTGGGSSGGGTSATGGAAGTGGMASGGSSGTVIGPVASGGARTGTGGSGSGGTRMTDSSSLLTGGNGTGGLPATGGGPGTTGGAGSGGTWATGGAGGTGASSGGTGGPRASGGAAGTGGGGGGGGNPGACTCTFGNPATTTLDCFCSRYECMDNLAFYTSPGDAGASYQTLAVYDGCNLVVVRRITSFGPDVYVFDLGTGKLVGASYTSDVVEACPWLPDVGFRTLSAGSFPETTCTLSRCTNGTQPLIQPCPDAGA